MKRGWWRRNVWGLVLLLPLTAGIFASNADRLYEDNIKYTPRQPVPVDASGTAELDDFRVSVTSFEPVSNDDPQLVDRGITLPASVQGWRAVLTFAGPETGLGACNEVALIDERERFYPARPDTLSLGAYTCHADEFEDVSPYPTTFYFLLPAQSRPQAVRVVWTPLLPRYVRLPVQA